MAPSSSSRALVPAGNASNTGVAAKVGAAILHVVGEVPASSQRRSSTPAVAARKIANVAAAKAASAAGTLALPPGPLGWLTVLPEMLAVWRIQAQMVADIAALYGRADTLTEEQMLYCLFKQAASQAVRDLVVRVGERVVIRHAAVGVLQGVAQKVGIKLTQRMVAKSAARWLPVVGAIGVAAYAYHDTVQVGRAAVGFFEQGGGADGAL